MDKKSTIVMALIVIVAVLFIVFVAFKKTTVDTNDSATTSSSTTEWADAVAQSSTTPGIKTVVTAKHAYRNGVHIVAGEIPLPSPCHILESTGSASASKDHVFIELASTIKTGETCPESITGARFKVSVPASKNATISATLNGREVILNLIEAGPNENLDNFELYIKG